MKNSMGSFIAEKRKEKGLTQQALADKLHITNKAVSKWERNLSCPDISLLTDLADILDVSVAELLSGKDLTIETPPAIDTIITNSVKQYSDDIKRYSFKRMVVIVVVLSVLTASALTFYHNYQLKEYRRYLSTYQYNIALETHELYNYAVERDYQPGFITADAYENIICRCSKLDAFLRGLKDFEILSRQTVLEGTIYQLQSSVAELLSLVKTLPRHNDSYILSAEQTAEYESLIENIYSKADQLQLQIDNV